MNRYYVVKKNIDKIRRGEYTFFINHRIYKEICYSLKKDEYSIYYPYLDFDKFILYTSYVPNIRLLEIESYFSLTHSEILGSLFGLNINDEVFGDIVMDDGKYYIYVMDEIYKFILDNFKMVGNKSIKIHEVGLDTLSDYVKRYEELEFIVSSFRIDTVIARIIGSSRDKVKEKIKRKTIMMNYDVLSSGSYVLKENDVFSIKKYGKYKFMGIVKTTKKDNYIIKIYKYV